MRLIYFLIGCFFIANLVVFLMPSEQQRINEGFTRAQEVAPQQIVLMTSKSSELVASSGGGTFSDDDATPVVDVAADGLSNKIDGKCYRVGPFLHSSRLSLAKAQLNNMGVFYTVEKRESTPAEVFRVYVGPFDSDARGRSARQELTELGIYDHFQKQDEDGRYIVSLGIYSRRTTADNSRERFESRNLNAKVRPEKTVLPDSYWLSLLGRELVDLPVEVLQNVDWGEYSAQFGSYECQA